MAKAKAIKTIQDLTPDPANVNKGTERGHYQLDWSITENGAGRSILADADGVVIAGNKTLEVAADHQLPVRVIESDGTELIVVQRTDLRLRGKGKEATRARSLAIADNRVSETNYEADIERLLEHQAAGVDLSPLYRQDELDAMIAGLTPPELSEGEPSDAEPQIDRAEELNKKWKVKAGDLFQIGNHKLLCGDSTKAESLERVTMGASVDIVHADPPYGIDLLSKAASLGKSQKYKPIIGDDKDFDPSYFLTIGKHQLFWGANHFASRLPSSPFWLVWDKQGGAKDITYASCELAWCSDPQPARVLTHIWDGFRRDSEKGVQRYHPNQKPVAVIQWAIKWLNGQSIFEPFAGSGTTMVAAENEQKECYAVELDPNYCAVILERMATAFPDIEIRKIK